MKARLIFDLEKQDDQMAHLRCLKSLDMALAMWMFIGSFAAIVDTSEDGKWIDEKDVWNAWEEAMKAHDINLDKLII